MDTIINAGRSIAIIDDDPAVLSALGFALRAEGYAVAAFGEPDTMLADVGLADVDCLVLDQRLDGCTGLGLLAELRRMGVTAPAVLITTHPDVACRRDADRAGVVIVEKPLMGDALARVIGTMIQSRGAD